MLCRQQDVEQHFRGARCRVHHEGCQGVPTQQQRGMRFMKLGSESVRPCWPVGTLPDRISGDNFNTYDMDPDSQKQLARANPETARMADSRKFLVLAGLESLEKLLKARYMHALLKLVQLAQCLKPNPDQSKNCAARLISSRLWFAFCIFYSPTKGDNCTTTYTKVDTHISIFYSH